MTTAITKKFLNLTTIGSFVVALSVAGCSNKDGATEEPVEADADTQAGTAPESPAPLSPAAPAPSQKVEAVAPESVGAPTTTPSSGSPAATNFSTTGRRVMYVKVDGAVLRDKPEPKASVVGKLNRGDHMLVTIEGDWAKTDDGKYVSTKVLSEKGIGRAKRDASWTGGSSGSASSSSNAPKKSGKKTNSAPNTKSPEPTKDGAGGDSNP